MSRHRNVAHEDQMADGCGCLIPMLAVLVIGTIVAFQAPWIGGPIIIASLVVAGRAGRLMIDGFRGDKD